MHRIAAFALLGLASFFTPAAAEEAASDGGGAKPRIEGGAYLEIPLRGVFGEDIVVEGVEKTFEHARSTGVRNIVFTIDSPGGYVATAQGILELMKKNDDRFEYHALVTR